MATHITITADAKPLRKAITEAEKAVARFAKEHGLTKKAAMKILRVQLARLDDHTTWHRETS